MKFWILIGLIFLLINAAFTQEKMTWQQYQHQLTAWANREIQSKRLAEQLQIKIDSLNQEIKNSDAIHHELWQEIYQLVGSNEAEVNQFLAELDKLENRVDEITAEVRSRQILSTTLSDGETLEQLAARPEVYGDKTQWPRLFSYNAELLQYNHQVTPGMKLQIHRHLLKNEYLTGADDTLSKIANLANISTQWQLIYKLNLPLLNYFQITAPDQKLPAFLLLKLP
ncbi:LysM peptidoglycan-binding domain-containing protein [candidate division KSB1 bacterium]|nr:LysM peptidoglycan-binding domain-containing protein [candidate division KSB1 bacterium]